MTGAAMTTWDPAGVIAKAKELIHSSNYEKVGEARKAVDDTIADWVRAVQQLPPSDIAQRARGGALIAAIWREYAALEIALRQFKQATKVFESAASCPVAGASLELWLQYAAFCVERKKFSNARKVFLRALAAVAPSDRAALWPPFHAFVVTHIEPSMTLATLQAQVPTPPPVASAAASVAPPPPPLLAGPAVTVTTAPPAATTATASTVTPSSAPPTAPVVAAAPAAPPADAVNGAAATPASSSTAEPTVAVAVPLAKTALVQAPMLDLDPALAFVDKTGSTALPAVAAADSRKRAGSSSVDANADASKRVKTLAAAPTLLTLPPLAMGNDLQHFCAIPTALPCIPACPHLLFDALPAGERHVDVSTAVCDALPDVLRDSSVFSGVKDLCDQQRQRDRATLYRWQDLVGMQMKEGSELLARHVDVARQLASAATTANGDVDDDARAALTAQQLAQRREFIARCQMSQQQFIEITGLDRSNALVAQQSALERLKVPEMRITADADAVAMQRAILALILEAQKLWREETNKRAAAAAVTSAPVKKVAASESRGAAASPDRSAPRATAYYPKSQQDHASHGHASRSSGSGSFRGGRSGGGYGGRGGGGGGGGGGSSAEHRYSNPRGAAPHSARSGAYRRDHDSYAQPSGGSGYDHHVPRQQLQVRPASYQAAPYQQQSQPQSHRAVSGYSDRGAALVRDYSPNFGPQPQEMARGGRFDSGGAPAWQQQGRHAPHQSRGGDFGSSSRYRGGGASDGGQLLPPPAAVSSYSNGPPQSRGRAYGVAAGNGGMGLPPPQQQQQYGGYGSYADAPAPMQQHRGPGAYQQAPHVLHHDDYDSSDYGAPQSTAPYSHRGASGSYQQQQQAPPYQQQQQQSAPFQQRGSRGGGGYGGYPQQQQPQMHMGPQQAQGYGRGGGGYRRGGGGGGRFGRR